MPGKKPKQCKVTLEGQDDTHAATLYVTAEVCVLLGRLSTHKNPAALSQAGGPAHGGTRWLLLLHIRTWVRVSGRRNPTSPPHTSTVEASRMGIALVMLTKEPNIRFPRTAAALQSAFKKPKPVALQEKETWRTRIRKRHAGAQR